MESVKLKLKCVAGMDSKFVTVCKGASPKTLTFSSVLFSGTKFQGTILDMHQEDGHSQAVGADIGRADYRFDMQGGLGVADLYIPIYVITIETANGIHEFRVRIKPDQLTIIKSWIA